MGNTTPSGTPSKAKNKKLDEAAYSDSRTGSIDSGTSTPSRRRSVSSADGLRAGRAANEKDERGGTLSPEGRGDPDDPLGGFNADAPAPEEEEAELADWGEAQLARLKSALRRRLESMGPDDSVSIKALCQEQVRACGDHGRV